jgi:hypothetical protein
MTSPFVAASAGSGTNLAGRVSWKHSVQRIGSNVHSRGASIALRPIEPFGQYRGA